MPEKAQLGDKAPAGNPVPEACPRVTDAAPVPAETTFTPPPAAAGNHAEAAEPPANLAEKE